MAAHQPACDFPQIVASNYGWSTIYDPVITTGTLPPQSLYPAIAEDAENEETVLDRLGLRHRIQPQQPSTQEPAMSSRRIVQIFIADPNENVPLDDALLYRGEVQFTDATDQELYFAIPIVDLLKAHNAKRKTWLDKDASRKSGKDIYLEPAKIRDLKMVVVNIATF